MCLAIHAKLQPAGSCMVTPENPDGTTKTFSARSSPLQAVASRRTLVLTSLIAYRALFLGSLGGPTLGMPFALVVLLAQCDPFEKVQVRVD